MLDISPGLSLPLEAVTETFALIAKRRVGKSNAAVVMAEQMYDAGIPWVAIDPKGDWWGVRSSADGTADGLSVVIFGGEHGDVPLVADAGTYMADLIAERRISCVLDVSDFSKGDEVKFLYAFATRLLKVNRHPLHLFLEECDDYIPQSMVKDVGGISEAQLVRAFSKLVRQGGFKGIGSTLVTQRPALVNNNVLSQTETMIALRTMFPDDQAKVKSWVSGHATKEQAAQIMESLATLDLGEAWVISPAFLGSIERIRFHRRRTFDSGATPKMGEERIEPTRLADVDLAAVKEAMAETIEQSKADDPKELRRRIRELERRLAERPTAEPERIEVPVEVEVPVLDEALVDRLEQVLAGIANEAGDMASAADGITVALQEAKRGGHDRQAVPRTRPAGNGAPARPVGEGRRPAERVDPPGRRDAGRPAVPRPAAPEGVKLGAGEVKVLTAIARHRDGVTAEQLSVLTAYKRSSRNTYVQRLRSAGMVDLSAGRLHATDEGLAVLGDDFEPLPTGAALRSYWLAELPEGERRILAELVDAWPDPVDHEVLDERTGYKRSSRNTYLQRLGARQLVEKMAGAAKASDLLFDET